MTFSEQVLDFHNSLNPNWKLPKDFELIYPYGNEMTLDAMRQFYQKYYSDNQVRTFLFGINPGRFGAGVTGVPFTDPIRLEEVCGIQNDFKKRSELSSIFVYEFIEAFGGIETFNQHFYVSSICPLGFIKDGKNINYYDDKKLEKAVEKYIIQNFEEQLKFGCNRKIALCMGQGKNFKYFKKMNEKLKLFEKIIPLPHPRWVMQYRRKRKQEFIDQYISALEEGKSSIF